MLIEWILATSLASICIYLFVVVFYYKKLLQKAKTNSEVTKSTLSDAEIVINKYKTQLQKSLESIDKLNDKIKKINKDLASMKTKSSQFRSQRDKLKKELEEVHINITEDLT